MASSHPAAFVTISTSAIGSAADYMTGHEPTRPKVFNDGDEVIFVDGTMTGLTGKVVETDSRPGETAVFVTAWGIISYGIPEDHLFRLNP